MPVVNTTLLDPSGAPLSRAQLVIRLVASPTDPIALGWKPSADSAILGRETLYADEDGLVSVTLEANDDLEPANTYYEGLVYGGGHDAVVTFRVPVGVGPHDLYDLLITPPASLDPLHETAADPHSQYVLESATPGGELGGTYAVPTVDATHSGSTHAATQAAAEAAAAAALITHAGTPHGGGGVTDADFLVGTSHAGLSAEIVVGATPGGEIGGTWASPTVDATHSGSTHAAAQAAAEATAAAALAAHNHDAAYARLAIANTFTEPQTIAGTANNLTLSGSAAGLPVRIEASGDDANVDIYLAHKGFGMGLVLGADPADVAAASKSYFSGLPLVLFGDAVDTYAYANLVQCGAGPTSYAGLGLFTSRGTLAVPTALQTGDPLGGLVFGGYRATAWWFNLATITAFAEGNFTDVSAPTSLLFQTTPTGSITSLDALKINSDRSLDVFGRIDSVLALATDTVLAARVTDDSVDRLTILADGKLSWGPGNGAADTILARGAAARLDLTGSLLIGTAMYIGATDVPLVRGGAGISAQRDGNNPQVHHLNAKYTNDSNYERLALGTIATDVLGISTQNLGTGAARHLWAVSGNQMFLMAASGQNFNMGHGTTAAPVTRFLLSGSSGSLLPGADISYDFGSAAARLRDVYVGRAAYVQSGANGQLLGVKSLTELTTIAAAATTDTTIQKPANAIILAVSVRVTVVIPTAATFTVGDAAVADRDSTAAVAVAANSTDPGTKGGAYFNATATAVRITPNGTPAANTGRVRVTIHYIESTAPTS